MNIDLTSKGKRSYYDLQGISNKQKVKHHHHPHPKTEGYQCKKKKLTWVNRGNGSSMAKVAALGGHPILEEVIVKCIGSVSLNIIRLKAGAALLYRLAISSPLVASPVHGRLQCDVVGIVLSNTPKLLTGALALGGQGHYRKGEEGHVE